MPTDLQNRPADSDEDSRNPGDQHYNDVFNQLTSPDHYNKNAEEPDYDKSGDETDDSDSSNGSDGKKGEGTSKSASADELKQKEEDAGKQSFKFNPADVAKYGAAGLLKSKAQGLLRNKKFMIIGGLAGGSLSAIIIASVFILALLKVPTFAEQMLAYQFARSARDYSQRANNVDDTKLAIDASDDSTYQQLKTRYYESKVGQAHTKVNETWDKLDKYRPQKVIDNLKANETVKYNTETTKLGRERLTSITVGDKEVKVNSAPIKGKLIPGYNFVNDKNFAAEFRPAYKQALMEQNIKGLVRGAAMRKMRQQLGIGLIAWHIEKFKGKTPDEAKVEMAQETYEAVNPKEVPHNANLSDKTNNTVDEAKQAEQADMQDPAKVKDLIEHHANEVDPSVQKVVDNALTDSAGQSTFKTTLGFVDPAYAIAAPVCMIYEGSMVNNGDTITQADQAAQRSFVQTEAGASQEKEGYHANGQAVEAFSNQFGDIEHSNVMIRASGGTVDTSKTVSNQASPVGQFSIYDALFPSPLDTIMDHASSFCPIFTNVWGAGLIGGASIFGSILTGGGLSLGEAGADVSASATVKLVAGQIVERILGDKTLTQFGKSIVLQGSATYLATQVAHFVVLSRMGSVNTPPVSMGVPHANTAENGANSFNSNFERTALAGAPLGTEDIAQNNIADAAYRAGQVRAESPYQRYLAITNPDSLANHVGMTVATAIHASTLSSMLTMAGNALNPAHSIGTVVKAINISKVNAADGGDVFNYGNVQFGFTAHEQSLIANDDTYKNEIYNQDALDASGKEDEIIQKFGPCFDLNTTIGDLLTKKTGDSGDNEYYIVRLKNTDPQKNGEVSTTKGLCSQANVGPNSVYNGGEYGDLVFRYRLAIGYNTVNDHRAEEQDPSDDTSASSDSSQASGDQQPDGTISIRDTSAMTCPVGTDDGVQDGYSDGNLYKTRVCIVQGSLMSAQIAVSFNNLLNAAKAANVPLTGSTGDGGFRTMDQQKYYYNCYITKHCNNGNLAAVPGHSNHQMGLANDFKCNGVTIVSGDTCFQWLQKNAGNFGFKNLPAEAWHWSYNGT